MPGSRGVPEWLDRDRAALRDLASSSEQVSDPPGDPIASGAALANATAARATLDRLTLLDPVLRAVHNWREGGGPAPVRTHLLAAADVDQTLAGLAHLVPTPLGGTASTAPPPRAPRPRTSELDPTQAALAVAAIASARTPEEAIAFALLTIPAIDDLSLLRQRASILVGHGLSTRLRRRTPLLRRDPRRGVGPGGGPIEVPPLPTDDRLLRLPPDLDLRGPGEDRPKVPGWEFIEGWLDALLAFEPGDCLRNLYVLAAQRRSQFAPYRIDRVVPQDACPGDPVEIFGVGFGDPPTAQTPAQVVFTTAHGGTVTARIFDWSPTHVRLRVPAQATPGPVGISREVATVRSECAEPVPVFQSGEDGTFHGGSPVVHFLHVNGQPRTDWMTTPTSEVTLSWDTSPAPPGGASPGHTVTLFVATKPTAAGRETVLANRAVPPGPGRYGVRVTTTTHLRASIRVSTPCGEAVAEVPTVLITAPLDLEQVSVEVTQTIQRHDPTGRTKPTLVPMVPGRDAAVRVYARPRETWFDWGAGHGVLPVTGELVVDVGGVDHRLPLSGAVSATTPTQRGERAAEPAEGARAAPPAGLLQVVPGPLVTGNLQVRARLQADPVRIPGIGVGAPIPMAESVTAATAWPPHPVRTLLPVLVELPAYRGTPTPTLREWVATVDAGLARLPIALGEWRVLSPRRVTADPDLRLWHEDTDDERDAWGDLLSLVDDARTDRDLGSEVLAIGLLPAIVPTERGGIRGKAYDRGSAFVTLPGRPRVFAHEFAHLFGVDHGGCWTGDTPPRDIDTSLPTVTEEVGLDLRHPTGPRVVRQGTAETMSYCVSADAEPSFGWGSIVLWERLRELFGRRR